ncbi:MAG: winged helix-turn-helix transcriptional regulator [Thermoplasmatota archaeon]
MGYKVFPGALPTKLEFILKEDFSLPRNPTIAKIFRYIRLAESIGSGFHKMIEGWKEHYRIEPIIEGDFDYFKITFPFPEKVTTDKSLSTTEKEILDLIASDPNISQRELADRIGITVDGIRYNMDKLKERGIIKRIGGKKTGHWEVLI